MPYQWATINGRCVATLASTTKPDISVEQVSLPLPLADLFMITTNIPQETSAGDSVAIQASTPDPEPEPDPPVDQVSSPLPSASLPMIN